MILCFILCSVQQLDICQLGYNLFQLEEERCGGCSHGCSQPCHGHLFVVEGHAHQNCAQYNGTRCYNRRGGGRTESGSLLVHFYNILAAITVKNASANEKLKK